MADRKHIKIAKKGTEAIAKWRRARPSEGLSLAFADLSDTDLSNASLYNAALRGASLHGADLRASDLRNAELCSADLDGANLSGAHLNHAQLDEAFMRDANLVGANLSDAGLKYVNLRGADLSDANLDGATLIRSELFGARLCGVRLANTSFVQCNLDSVDLSGAKLGDSTFSGIDLSQVQGLESSVHLGPSTIGVDTLIRSKGKIPKVFLKNCGVPEVWIEYLPTLIGAMEPIQLYSCFLSHSSKDDAFARRLHGRLEREKLRVWFAPEDMKGGKRFARQIDEAIRVYDRLLLVLSEHSMDSEWVRREIKKARKKEKETGREVLFPIRLVDIARIREWECLDSDSGEDLAEKVREYHIPDFSKWKEEDEFEKGFASLMRDLRREDEGRSTR